jgi:tRNA(Ile)-lysidine synthase
VLLHLLRGAGPAGLRGMRPLVPWPEWAEAEAAAPPDPAPVLIRPLLDVPRAALNAYCAAAGLTPRDDPSNQSAQYTRSRVRRTLLPAFQALNPAAVAALGRTAAICADDYAYIQGQLDAVWPTLTHSDAHRISFAGAAWSGLHAALQRYALRRAAAILGRAEVSLAQIEAARACTTAGVGKRSDIGPDLRLETTYDGFTLQLRQPPPEMSAPQLEPEHLPLANGTTALGNGWLCVVQHEPPAQPSPWWIGLDVAGAVAQLSLRRRKPGDRIRPAGGRGSRKLQDLFVDRKIPRAQRDAWPILLVGDQIAWVAGLRADAAFAVPPEQATMWVGIIRDTQQ